MSVLSQFGGRIDGPEIVQVRRRLVKYPDVAAYTLPAELSGRVFVMPNLTADTVITMPAEAEGLEYEFIFGGVAADAQDWQFNTGANANYFLGGITHLDDDAGTGAAEVVVVYPDGNSNSKLNILTPEGGTRVHLICDGTLWYVNGLAVSATAPTFADQ